MPTKKTKAGKKKAENGVVEQTCVRRRSLAFFALTTEQKWVQDERHTRTNVVVVVACISYSTRSPAKHEVAFWVKDWVKGRVGGARRGDNGRRAKGEGKCSIQGKGIWDGYRLLHAGIWQVRAYLCRWLWLTP